MTDYPVGFGEASATIAAGRVLAGPGDRVVIGDEDAFGFRVYMENLTPKDGVTFLSDDPEKPYTIIAHQDAPASSTCTVADAYTMAQGGSLTGADVTTTYERCWFMRTSLTGNHVDIRYTGTTTLTFNNCIMVGGNRGYNITSGTAVVTLNFCIAAWVGVGFRRAAGTMICNNCIGWQCGDNYFGLASGRNNASSTTGGTAGVTDDISGIDEDDLAPAYLNSPAGASQFPMFELRAVESVLSGGALDGTGWNGTGVTTDINGRVRADPPNVGPTEGFLGFATAAPSVPGAPEITAVA